MRIDGKHPLGALSLLAAAVLAITACGTTATPSTSPTAVRPSSTAAPTPTASASGQPTAIVGQGGTGYTQGESNGMVPLAEMQAAKRGGTLRGIYFATPKTLDSLNESGQFETTGIVPLSSKLLALDPTNLGQITPDLAESYKFSADGTVVSFTLRRDVKWHDGTPFTSADVVATYDRMDQMWNKFKLSARHGGLVMPLVKSYRAPDDYTFEVTLKAPGGYYLAIIASGLEAMQPKHKLTPLLAKSAYEPMSIGDDNPPIGTGPFKFKKWTPDVSIEWVRNDQYFKKDPFGQSLPYLDALRFSSMKDFVAQYAALRTGQVDFWPPYPQMAATDAYKMEKALPDKVRLFKSASSIREGITFNMMWQFGRNPQFRQAVALIVDQEEFKERIFDDEAYMGVIVEPNTFPGYGLPDEEMAKVEWLKQPKTEAHAKARKILAELGISPQTPMEIRLNARAAGLYPVQGELLVAQLAPFGIKAKLEVYPPAVGSAMRVKGEYHMAPQGAGNSIYDPIQPLFSFYKEPGGGNPDSTWVTPTGGIPAAQTKINELFDKGRFTVDPQIKKQAILDALRVLYFEESPLISLGYGISVQPVYKYVKGHFIGAGAYEGMNREYTWLDR